MNTELLREYRTISAIAPNQILPFLETRLRMYGFGIQETGKTHLCAALEADAPGRETVLQSDVFPQVLDDGTFDHADGNDASCAMLLYTLRNLAGNGFGTGRIRVQFGSRDEQGSIPTDHSVEIGLASASQAKLGTAVIRCPKNTTDHQMVEDCVRAAKSVMGSVSIEDEQGSNACTIFIGANPIPDLGTPGMKFHMLALENGADILEELLRMRHAS